MKHIVKRLLVTVPVLMPPASDIWFGKKLTPMPSSLLLLVPGVGSSDAKRVICRCNPNPSWLRARDFSMASVPETGFSVFPDCPAKSSLSESVALAAGVDSAA